MLRLIYRVLLEEDGIEITEYAILASLLALACALAVGQFASAISGSIGTIVSLLTSGS